MTNDQVEFDTYKIVLSDLSIGNDFLPFVFSHIAPTFTISLLPVFIAKYA